MLFGEDVRGTTLYEVAIELEMKRSGESGIIFFFFFTVSIESEVVIQT